MVEVEFIYESNRIIILGKSNETLDSIINKYVNSMQLEIDKLTFISKETIINGQERLENIMNESEKKNKKITILVFSVNNDIENTNIKKSEYIICPECKENCNYSIKNYKIKFYDCKNEHIIENIKLKEFEEKQNIDISSIKCDNCKEKNKSNIYNNEFYICYECKKNLCPLCKLMHDKSHSIINYDNKNYICNKHNEKFVQYCQICKKDLCLSCSNEHENHQIILYQDEIIDIKKLRKKMTEFESTIIKFKVNLEEAMNKFKKIMENMDIIYNINNNLLKYYEKNKDRNYKLLINIKNMEQYINEELNCIAGEYDYGNNLNKLLYLYNEMEDKNEEKK